VVKKAILRAKCAAFCAAHFGDCGFLWGFPRLFESYRGSSTGVPPPPV
jgi:hypothetical protein